MTNEILAIFKNLNDAEALKTLKNINEYPDIFNTLKSNIPTVTINGNETVDPKFQKMILNYDPLGSKSCLKNNENGEQCITSLGVFNLSLLSVIKKIIRSMTMDFSERCSSWEEYLNGVESLGFVEILELQKLKNDKPTKDIIKYFWSYDHSILWIVDSFTSDIRHVNGSNIYFQGINRDPSTYHDLPINHSVAYNTNISIMSCDMREMPTYKLFNILEKFKMVEYWLEYNCYNSELQFNFNALPKDIQDYMTSRIALPLDLKKSYIKKTSMHKEVEDFIKSLSEQELKLGMAWVSHFGYKDTKLTRLPKSFYPLMNKFSKNIDVNFEAYVSALLFKDSKRYKAYDLENFLINNLAENDFFEVYL